MSRVLVITEKPQASQAVMDALGQTVIQGREVDTVFVYPISWWQWKVPKKTPLRKIPATPESKDMAFRLNPAMSLIPYGQMCQDGEMHTISKRNGFSVSDFRDKLVDRWSEYSLIICMPDDDRNGWGSLVRWLQWFSEADQTLLIGKEIRCMRVDSFEGSHLRRQYDDSISIADPYIGEMSRRFEVKHLFDAWWNTNSGSVFGIAQRKAGFDPRVMVTKYEVMTLHIMDQYSEATFKDFQLIGGMEIWSGTGKYKARPDDTMGVDHPVYRFATTSYESSEQTRTNPTAFSEIGIGTPASRGSIIKKLADRAWIRTDDDERISVTEEGKGFLKRCHKDTFDPDLPFRLEEWILNNDVEAMKRYIRRYFSKQKRFVT